MLLPNPIGGEHSGNTMRIEIAKDLAEPPKYTLYSLAGSRCVMAAESLVFYVSADQDAGAASLIPLVFGGGDRGNVLD